MLLNLVIPVKLLIFKKWFGVYLFDSSAQSVVLIIDYLIHLTIYSSIVYIFSSILRFLTQRSNNEARLKDNYSILIYASIPYLVGAVILFPFELILFGNFLFSANPSPFVFKEVQAYLMLMFESILIIWSFLLTFFAVKVQTNKNIVSFIFSLSFNGINFLLLKVISYFLS
ncbi:MAG: hypothetical protein HXY49_01120 [Ignavibacteriaceae bacterium]|nr:hypothetical protein [Ignavibacteriaceae bacterium]